MGFDLILVPGAGVRQNGELPPWVTNRFDRAIAVAGDASILALSAGTVHKPPPLDSGGRPIFEASAGARYLIERGFPADRILLELASYDTIGNAYFARVVHVEPAGFRNLLIVNSGYHMPRTEAIFGWVFGLPGCACSLRFETVPDAMEAEVLAARVAKEQAALRGLPRLVAEIRCMRDLHRWLFTRHGAYTAAAGQPITLDSKTAASY